MTFTQEDRDLLMQKGISESQIEEQLSCFKTGFPFLKLKSPASIGNGILSLDEKESGKAAAAKSKTVELGTMTLEHVEKYAE